MTMALKAKLKIKRLNVIIGFSWASTAPLNAMQKMVTKKSKVILKSAAVSPINNTIAAADPKQLCPIMAMEE